MEERKKRWGKGGNAAGRLTAWVILLVLLAMSALTGCGLKGAALEAYDAQYLDYFDTITSITVYAKDEEQAKEYIDAARSRLEYYHKLFDIYHNYDGMSNIKSINDSAGSHPVAVEPELMKLLELSLQMCGETGGKMNVAMGSVLSIWHDYREDGISMPERAQVPDMSVLEKAAAHTDIRQMHLDKAASTVYLADPDMRLDVGAIAKGFAAQRVVDKLRESGVTSALVSIGGNVETIGVRGDGKPWRVGVQNPDTSSSRSYLHAVKLQDLALVTSGTYQRYYEVDGVRYHHIVNPDLLMPWQEYASVTILCPDSGRADALSTAVFNMEPEEGLAFVESLENTEAMWVFPDGKEMFSSGFEAYLDD